MKGIAPIILWLLFLANTVKVFSQYYSPYGGPFTPYGDLRILIVYAGFENKCDEYPNSIWPSKREGQEYCKTFPLFDKELFYSDYSSFSPHATDKSISNFYYQMSRNHPSHPPLRIVADIFPERINISGNSADNSALFRKIQERYPDFDWSRYDNRTNHPYFKFDNTTTGPDKIIDYIVVIWRDKGSSGYANTNNFTFTTTINGVKEEYKVISSCGFTLSRAMADHTAQLKKSFHHELAHTLFNCPHVFYTNGVLGDYFYSSSGWGTMSYGFVNSSTNAWESWYCGWIELPENRDLKDFRQNGVYTLRDFVTTGDAMRIKLPFSNQYLWIENHTGKSVFDQRDNFYLDGTGDSIPTADKGLYLFVENISSSRTEKITPLDLRYANGLKTMHSGGNYDYVALDVIKDPKWWNNIIVNFQSVEANPTGAHNDVAVLRGNFEFETEFPEKILHRRYTNNRNEYCESCGEKCSSDTRQEAAELLKKNGTYNYGQLGIGMAFGTGKLPQKIGMSSNPMIINHQRYDCSGKLDPIYLHGISITILSRSTQGDITFEVRFDDTKITSDQRMTGDLILQDVEHAEYDLVITSGNTLTLDKSGTPNRHDKGKLEKGSYEFPDFINPSMLTIEKGAKVLIEENASLVVKNGSTLRIKEGAVVVVKGSGSINVKNRSYIDIEPGATIESGDNAKAIHLAKKAKRGINPKLKL